MEIVITLIVGEQLYVSLTCQKRDLLTTVFPEIQIDSLLQKINYTQAVNVYDMVLMTVK